MERVILQFQGVDSAALLTAAMCAVSLALLCCSAWAALRLKWARAATCFAAAIPTVIICFARGRLDASWWVAAVGLQVLLAVGIFYSWAYSRLKWRRITVLMLLRTAAVGAILLIMFKPVVQMVPPFIDARPVLPVLIDASRSMSVADGPGGTSRLDQAAAMLISQQGRLEEHFRPVVLRFAGTTTELAGVQDAQSLSPDAEDADRTNILLALETALHGRTLGDVAGVLLLSDGIENVSKSVNAAVGAPVFALGVGSADAARLGKCNTGILAVDAPFEAMKNNATDITVRVNARGAANARTELQLFEEDRLVATAPVVIDGDKTQTSVELKWTPRQANASRGADIRRLRLDLSPLEGETALEDNSAHLHVLVSEPRLRVLYVEGTIRSEYKFLMRTLATDPNIQFMSLVRVRESEFSAYGGINNKTLSGLPAGKEDFDLFDVLVIGDLDAAYWTPEQLNRIKDFVLDGGGLLMIGGHNSFGPGGYAETPLEEVLPVIVGPRSQPQEGTPFAPILTAEGREHPIFDGIAGYFGGPGNQSPSADLPKLPELRGCVTVVKPKPMASVLAVNSNRRNEFGPLVVLATGFYGKGRSAAFTADTTWLWRLPLAAEAQQGPYERFWGQMMRYLADVKQGADAHPSVIVRPAGPQVAQGRTLTVRAQLRGIDAQASAGAEISAAIIAPDGESRQRIKMALAGSTDLYKCDMPVDWSPFTQGRHMIAVTVLGEKGDVIASDEMPLHVAAQSAEMDSLARNDSLLRNLSSRTGGRYADISQMPELVDVLIDRRRTLSPAVGGAKTYRMYSFPVLFTLCGLLLTSEWLLRRKWQLR